MLTDVPEKDITTIITALRERIITRVDIPTKFICYNGNQFSSRLFQLFTVPYILKTIGSNKTITAKFTFEIQRHWEDFLSELGIAFNTAVSKANG